MSKTSAQRVADFLEQYTWRLPDSNLILGYGDPDDGGVFLTATDLDAMVDESRAYHHAVNDALDAAAHPPALHSGDDEETHRYLTDGWTTCESAV